MINLSVLLRELSQLINANHLTEEQVNRTKDIICYLSEGKKKNQIPGEYLQTVDFLLYTASIRLRTFGYNRLNDFKSDAFNVEETSKLKDECITQYYSTPTNFVLDKQQKIVLDAFEEGGKKLFLSAPTSFGKTFLLKEIIYRNYDFFNNIVIVLPTVALLMEVTEDLTGFCDTYGLEYGIVNSIYRDLEIKEKNIFVYEEHLNDIVVTVGEQSVTLREFGYYIAKMEKDVQEKALIYNPKDPMEYWNVHFSAGLDSGYMFEYAWNYAVADCVCDLILYKIIFIFLFNLI